MDFFYQNAVSSTLYKISFNMICHMQIFDKNSSHFSCWVINEAKTKKLRIFRKSLYVNFFKSNSPKPHPLPPQYKGHPWWSFFYYGEFNISHSCRSLGILYIFIRKKNLKEKKLEFFFFFQKLFYKDWIIKGTQVFIERKC